MWSRTRVPLCAALFIVSVPSLIYLGVRTRHVYTVIDVSDGDTFCIQKADGIQVVQLGGADAPELHKDEPFAQQARYYLMDRLLHRRVRLETVDPARPYDHENRWVCWVWIGSENLSHTLVHHGLARFSDDAEGTQRSELLRLESVARTAGLGMWMRPQRLQREDRVRTGLAPEAGPHSAGSRPAAGD